MPRQCKATTVTGQPCSATPRPGRDWCRWHDPALQEQRRAERAAGGRARSNDARARRQLRQARMDPAEIEGLLCDALHKVTAGEMAPGILHALAAGARAIMQVRQAGEIEERLTALETRAGAGWSAS